MFHSLTRKIFLRKCFLGDVLTSFLMMFPETYKNSVSNQKLLNNGFAPFWGKDVTKQQERIKN